MNQSWKQYWKDMPRAAEAPPFMPIGKLRDASSYVPGEDLAAAVNVAIRLGLPLLVTGDPGCGKTQLAAHVADRFGQDDLIVFQAKTTSTAQDLFYRYDSLGHFHASNFGKSDEPPDVMRFIHPQALGLAILRALDPLYSEPFVALETVHERPRRSVVLIDEIDKAPRDFPNDVLDEIETMSFTVRETGLRVPPRTAKADPSYRPIVILTSNSERNLPDAFLRRCAYYHIVPPGKPQLLEIIEKRLQLDPRRFPKEKIDEAVELFITVRGAGLKKRPSTDELLKWLHMLDDAAIDPSTVAAGDREAVFITCSILSKSRDDAQRVEKLFARNP